MEGLTVYSDPKKFWNEASPFLKREEAKNSLCLGLSYLFQSNASNCLFQCAMFEGKDFLGSIVVSRYSTNLNLLPSMVSDLKVARKLYGEMRKANLPITGIVGEKKSASLFQELFEEAGKTMVVHMIQGIYRCRQVRLPEIEEALVFRIANEGDGEIIGKWVESFSAEATPHDPPVNGLEFALARIKSRSVYVLEKDRELVAMAGCGRDIGTSCSINLVFTPRTLRRNGYASTVTAKLTDLMLSSGKKETNLYTDMSNSTSNKIYQAIGYEFVCDSIHIGVKS